MTVRNPFGNGPTGKGESIAWVVFAAIWTVVLIAMTVIEWIPLWVFLAVMFPVSMIAFVGATGIAVYSDDEEAVEASRQMK